MELYQKAKDFLKKYQGEIALIALFIYVIILGIATLKELELF